ncbi:hypothetical protein [Marinobacterium aestuariivivens]|uniref:Uncharacterized protein n=1 Tax=Marinobacterium aestuariivivens TaxID=1698799 RepID=A0ABW1ZU58_9GAMM
MKDGNLAGPGLEIAACIEALGSGRFYPRFFQLMEAIARIDQYMVFGFSDDRDQARCYLAHNVADPELGVRLAAQYVDGNYRKDELLSRLADELLSRLADELLSRPSRPACELLLRGGWRRSTAVASSICPTSTRNSPSSPGRRRVAASSTSTSIAPVAMAASRSRRSNGSGSRYR